jgi:hypothetical protein
MESDRWRRCRNCRTRDARAAAKIDHSAANGRDAQLAHDVLDEQEVDGTVIHRKRRALAGAVKCPVIGERGFAAFDVRGRQRPQGPRDLAEPQVGQVTLL